MLNPFDDWISMFSEDMKNRWKETEPDLKKLSMIRFAFFAELEALKHTFDKEIKEIKNTLDQRNSLRTHKKLKALTQSEIFSFVPGNSNKENEATSPTKLINANEHKNNYETDIDSPQIISDSDSQHLSSPIIKKGERKSRLNRSITASIPFALNTKMNDNDSNQDLNVTPARLETEDVIDTSVIDNTPLQISKLRTSKIGFSLKRPEKPQEKQKSKSKSPKQKSPFGEPKNKKKKSNRMIDTNGPSMDISEIMHALESTDSSSDDDATIDITNVANNFKDDCMLSKDQTTIAPYLEVVRGKEARAKLRGWSCKECEEYYKFFNLSPKSMAKKMDECSRHRNRFKPPDDTFEGFWDLTNKETQDTQTSLLFNYK